MAGLGIVAASMSKNNDNNQLAGRLAAFWGVAGFVWILLDAILRLGVVAYQGLSPGLNAGEWATLVLFVLFMAYSEGYRGFQLSFSPRTAARAYYLYRHPDWLAGLLAPLFCMGFFRATRRPLLVAWVGTVLIVSIILWLRTVAQPWRGIVDAGVVVGLSWGLTTFLWNVRQAFRNGDYPVDPELPDGSR